MDRFPDNDNDIAVEAIIDSDASCDEGEFSRQHHPA